jgi:hypothetical protein
MSMDVIIDAVNALVDDARRDEGLRRWWTDVDAYVHKVRALLVLADCDVGCG